MGPVSATPTSTETTNLWAGRSSVVAKPNLAAGERDPFARLHARDQDGRARGAGLVDERLAFADIGKFLAEGVGDVGLVRYRQIIEAGLGRRVHQIAHGASGPGVLAVRVGH